METESTFAPPPTVDPLPGPDTFAPEAAPAAPMGSVGLVPSHLLERITIGPAPSWVVERSVEIIEAAKGGIDPGYLLDRQHHAGRGESYSRSVKRLGTMSDVHVASQWRVNMDPLTSRLTIHALIVRRGEQSTDNAKPDRLRVLQQEQGLEYRELDGLLTIVVLLEDVRVGDILDIRYTIESKSQLFPDHFSDWIVLPYWTLREFYWSVRFPRERAMHWKSSDSKLVPEIHEDDAETEWTWHLSKMPGAQPEPNVPGWHFEHPWIQVSDFPSWEFVASGVSAAWRENLEHPEVLRLVDSITAEAATSAQRATRALTYLQDEIRYLSVKTELGGQVPASPGVVIKRGFGDCKDKSFAAAHLLRLLGIPARPVLVHAALQQAVGDFLPTPDIFNHVIVEYEVEGRRRWVDVTASLQGGSLLSRTTARYKLGLPIGPGVTHLEEITREKSSDYRELRETYIIDTSGRPSILRVHVTAHGREADLWRHSLTFDGETQFARDREQFYQQLFSGLHRVGTLQWHDDRESNELEIADVFDLRDVVAPVQNGQAFYFRLWAHSVHMVLGFAESEKRKHPWALRFPCHIRHIIEIDSQGLPQNLAHTSQVEGKAFRFACQVQQRSGFASVSYDVRTLTDHVPAAEYDAYKAKVREVWPHIVLSGLLPRGSIVPWRARAPQAILRRGKAVAAPPKPAPPPPPQMPGANSQEAAAPAPALASPLREIAPPLTSRPPREGSNLTPRRENSPRTTRTGESLERHQVNRPNPTLPPRTRHNPVDSADPIEAGESATDNSSRRSRRQRRKRRQQQQLVLWLSIAVSVGLILLIVHFLL